MKRIMMLVAALMALLAPSAALADSQYKLLVLAIPNKYHYEYIPIARDSLEKMAKLHGFDLTFTNKPETFEGDLSQYAAVMFLNTAGDELNEKQRANFEAYMRAGGNAVGVHKAIIIPHGNWPWYEKMIGRAFTIHPLVQTAVVDVIDPSFPATYALPRRWIWTDEFYVLANPYNVTINPVLNVDESTYDPTKIWPGQVAKPMGKNHPMAWYHNYEKGRVFVTALGHNGEMYRDPTYLSMLMGGIYWAATGRGQAPH